MNLPNKLTMFRIILIIPIIFCLQLNYTIFGSILFAIACFTDYIDGYIARKKNLITDFGRLMDPLADKILVFACMMIFIEKHYILSWIVIIMIAREFLITGIRILASSEGKVIAASKLAKYKTTFQMVGVFIVIFTKSMFVSNIIMLVPLIMTILSGIEYINKNKKYFI